MIACANFDQLLPHLNNETAPRHFVTFAHEHADDRLECSGWFSSRTAAPH